MREHVKDFADLGSAASNAAIIVAEIVNKTVEIHGTFAATVQVQGSNDDVTWHDIGSTVTAPGLIDVASSVKFLRITVAPYTSGTIESRLRGLESRSDGG